MKPRSLRTSDVARAVGVHPNTVRLYEEWGFLPPIPRSPSGYRLFTEAHVDQMRLARTALRGPWPGRNIKRSALALVRRAASGNLGAGRGRGRTPRAVGPGHRRRRYRRTPVDRRGGQVTRRHDRRAAQLGARWADPGAPRSMQRLPALWYSRARPPAGDPHVAPRRIQHNGDPAHVASA
jgi:hypothetical protein